MRRSALLSLSAVLLAGCGLQSATLTDGPGSAPEAVQAASRTMQPQFWPRGPVAPPPGTDIVVFNDVNPFSTADLPSIPSFAGNKQLFRNLVNYVNAGPRGSQTNVWIDTGHGGNNCNNACTPAQMSTLVGEMTAEGYTVQFQNSNVGDLATIPANVKVLMLMLPRQAYTVPEINAMKLFAKDGGRVVFIGEHQSFYGSGIPIQNDFLLKMGAVMTNTGGAVDCGEQVVSSTNLRSTQVTTSVTSLKMACASVIQPGPQDFIFMYDQTGTKPLAGVARIDTTPLP